MTPRKNRSACSGLSLLEMVMSLSIFAVLMVLMSQFSSVYSVQHDYGVAQQDLENMAQEVLDELTLQLRQSSFSRITYSNPLSIPLGAYAAIQFPVCTGYNYTGGVPLYDLTHSYFYYVQNNSLMMQTVNAAGSPAVFVGSPQTILNGLVATNGFQVSYGNNSQVVTISVSLQETVRGNTLTAAKSASVQVRNP